MQQLIFFKTFPVSVAQSLVAICFFEIMFNTIQSFQAVRTYYFQVGPQQYIEQLLSFDLLTLYKLDSTLNSILFTLSLLYTIFITLVTLTVKYGNSQKIEKEIVLMKIARYNFILFEWILFGPIYTAFVYEIFAADSSSQRWTLFKYYSSMPGVLMLLCSQYVLTMQYKNYWQLEADIFATRRVFYFCSFQLYRTVLLTLKLVLLNSTLLEINNLFVTLQILFVCAQLYIILNKRSHLLFYDLDLTNLCNYLTIFNLSINIGQLISLIQGALDNSSLLKSHQLIIFAVVLIFSLPAYNSVKRRQILEILIQKQPNSGEQLALHLYFINIYRYDEKNLDFFLVINTKFLQLRSRHIFNQIYQRYLLEHPNDFEANMDYARFLFYKNRGKARAIKMCSEIQAKCRVDKTKISLLVEFKLQQILTQFKNTIEQLNLEAYEGYMDFEIVHRSEALVQHLVQQIQKIIQLNVRFWNHLASKSTIDYQLMEIDEEINKVKQSIQVSWRQLKALSQKFQDTLERKQEWYFLYCWYKLFIMNKKLKKQEQDKLFLKKSHHNVEESNQETLGIYDQYMALSENSAIFHTDINGKILKVSSQCTNLFGEGPFENINEIIPKVNQVFHDYVMKKFYSDGRQRRSLYRRKRIFCQSQSGFVMAARKYMKLYLNEQNDINYICMIRPIRKTVQKHYILLDSDWNIQGVSEQLHEHLPLTKLSILLLCPTFVKFSQFQKHLSIEDKINFRHTNPTQIRNSFSTLLQNDDAWNSQLPDNLQSFERKKTYNFTIRIPSELESVQQAYQNILDKAYNLKLDIHETQKKKVANLFVLHLQTRFKNWDLKRKVQLLVEKRNAFIIKSLARVFREHCSDIKQIDKVLQVSLQYQKKRQDKNQYYHLLNIIRFDWVDVSNQCHLFRPKAKLSTLLLLPQDLNSGFQIDTIRSQRSFLTNNGFSDDFPQNQASFWQISNSNNIFLKEESNKFRLSGSQILLQTIYIRLLLLFVVIIVSITGINDIIYPKSQINLGITQTEQIRLVDIATLQIYEHLVDIILFNENYTQSIYFNPTLSNLTSADEFYSLKSDKIFVLFDYIYIVYAYEGFVPTFYGLGQNLDVSIIDVFDQFQANLVFITQSNLSLLNFGSECYQELQMITIPDFQAAFYLTYLETLTQQKLVLQDTIQLMMTLLLFILCSQILFCFHSVIATFRAIKIKKRLYTSLNQISIGDIQQSILYWKSLGQQQAALLNLQEKGRTYQNSLQQKSKEQDRQLIQSKIWLQQKVISVFVLFIYYNLILGPLILYYLEFINRLQSCLDSYHENKFLLQPHDNWALVALKELYISENILRTKINIEAYENILKQVTRKDLYSNTVQGAEQFVLGNLCGDNDSLCQQSGLLSQGLVGFHRSVLQLIDSYFGDERFDNLSLFSIYKLSWFHDEYLLHLQKLHQLWSKKTLSTLDDSGLRAITILILVFVVLIHLVLFETIFNSWVQRKQMELKGFYKSYYPNSTLNQQKRLRAQFQRLQLI